MRARDFAFVSLLLCFASLLDAQGPLTPPGGPAPSMKALDQVASTGIAINATNTPGNASDEFVISSAGSYYLTGNLVVVKPNGIHVTASAVTIDLNGFQISQLSGSGGNGILIDAGLLNSAVRNGTVKRFNAGIDANGSLGGKFVQLTATECAAVGLRAGDGWQINGCEAHQNLGTGIATGLGCAIVNCIATNNASTGIYVGGGSTITDCVSNFNTGGLPFDAGTGCTIANCTANGNSGSGVAAINAADGCTIVHCAVSYNTSSNASSYGIFVAQVGTILGCTVEFSSSSTGTFNGSTGVGIYGGRGSIIKDCTSAYNLGDGIQLGGIGTVSGCTASSNGIGGVGSGISVGNDSQILACNVGSNGKHGVQTGQRSQVIDCNVNFNGTGAIGAGILADQRAVVRHCSAVENRNSGIVVLGDSVVTDNHVSRNGRGTVAAGIDTATGGGSGSRVDGNHLRDNNGTGILAGAFDVVIRNTVGGSATPFNPGSGTNFGPLQSPNAATNPMANISF